jgi:hypothetical protein
LNSFQDVWTNLAAAAKAVALSPVKSPITATPPSTAMNSSEKKDDVAEVMVTAVAAEAGLKMARHFDMPHILFEKFIVLLRYR